MCWGWKPGFRTSGMSSPTTEACDLPWVPARRLLAPNTIPAVGLEFVACGGAWPLGQLDYRTGVSAGERLRKEVYGRRRPRWPEGERESTRSACATRGCKTIAFSARGEPPRSTPPAPATRIDLPTLGSVQRGWLCSVLAAASGVEFPQR